jgi:hypothetical protein
MTDRSDRGTGDRAGVIGEVAGVGIARARRGLTVVAGGWWPGVSECCRIGGCQGPARIVEEADMITGPLLWVNVQGIAPHGREVRA